MIKLLLTKEVEVTWWNDRKLYEKKGYEFTKRKDKFKVKIGDLELGSNIKVDVLCDYCLENGKETISSVIYRNYTKSLKNSHLINKDACWDCRHKKEVELNLINYGVKSPFSLDDVREKIKNTNTERYGTEFVLNNKDIRAKINYTVLIRYGVSCIFKTKEIIESNTGENNINWKGGVTSDNNKDRNSPEYKEWRLTVFIRDKYTCQCCGKIGGYLNAHHIFCFSDYPELRFIVENGISLCKSCHSQTIQGSFHQLYGTHKNNYEQLKQYIEQKTGGEWDWVYIPQIIYPQVTKQSML